MWNGARLAFLPLAEYLAIGAIAVLGLGLAVSELQISARFADVSLVAERIEYGKPVSANSVAIIAADADEIGELGVCRSDIVLAGAKTVLQRIGNYDEATNYPAWWSALTAAKTYLGRALACLPGDGNLWLRYAAVDSTIAEGPEKAAKLMAISAMHSPADESDLLARVYFWNRFRPETVAAGRDVARKDVILAVQIATPADVRKAFPTVSPALKPFVIEAAKDISAQRRRALLRAGFDPDNL